ncbi:hypothetical protein GOB91_29290 [Sinorhizobium meliloti]|nr:hypothetical protein [Sinorhizobium meliloti]MDW9732650.1 hypothetical protein [Sinorhizobium meliloti]
MLVRLAIILVAPPVLLWVFVSELWHEVKSAPWYAWNACCQEMNNVRASWRAKSIRPEDWK